MNTSFNPRLLQIFRCRQPSLAITRLPQSAANRVHHICPLARTSVITNSHYNNSPIQDTCQLHTNGHQQKSSFIKSFPLLNGLVRSINQRWITKAIPNLEVKRAFHCHSVMRAGHSKWANIKNAKGAADHARALVFAKYAKLIREAIKEGGSNNPELNSRLAYFIKAAKSKDMPKASIENAMKNTGKSVALTNQVFEVKGPGNCAIIVDVMSEKAIRARQELNKMFKDAGLTAKALGGNMYAFERKGVIRVKDPSKEGQPELTLDLATEVAIEVEAEDVEETVDEEDEKVFMFICEPNQTNNVKQALKGQSYMVESADIEYVAVKDYLVQLSETNLENVSQIIQKIEAHPDVVKVYDNIA